MNDSKRAMCHRLLFFMSKPYYHKATEKWDINNPKVVQRAIDFMVQRETTLLMQKHLQGMDFTKSEAEAVTNNPANVPDELRDKVIQKLG